MKRGQRDAAERHSLVTVTSRAGLFCQRVLTGTSGHKVADDISHFRRATEAPVDALAGDLKLSTMLAEMTGRATICLQSELSLAVIGKLRKVFVWNFNLSTLNSLKKKLTRGTAYTLVTLGALDRVVTLAALVGLLNYPLEKWSKGWEKIFAS